MTENQSYLNRIFHGSSSSMAQLPDESVHLCVTSPPYNVGKDYEAGQTFEKWLDLCRSVFSEVKRVLVPGGRVCIVVANTGRNPYVPLHYYLIGTMLDLGYLMRGEVIWDKGSSVGSSTAWGSWLQATNPTLRDIHEYILILSKESYKREAQGRRSTISRDEFLYSTKSIWSTRTASAKKIGHPAPFPLEIPHRLIQLYSFEGDLVLDPFMGSGQTAIAALQNGRSYVGYDICPEYCELAESRVSHIDLTSEPLAKCLDADERLAPVMHRRGNFGKLAGPRYRFSEFWGKLSVLWARLSS